MSTLRRHLRWVAWASACAVPIACDGPCEPEPDVVGNQDPTSLEPCPALPEGIDPIAGLVSARTEERFDGLVITLSDRPLLCGDPAAQHGYCGVGNGVTVSLPPEQSEPGVHTLSHPVYIELETPNTIAVGGGGDLSQATVELYEVTDSCVTGRVLGLTDAGGPFDGGFRAPRCSS